MIWTPAAKEDLLRSVGNKTMMLMAILHSGEACYHISHLRQHCFISKCVIFQERILKVLKCY